jgi:hypothetical protein
MRGIPFHAVYVSLLHNCIILAPVGFEWSSFDLTKVNGFPVWLQQVLLFTL